MMKLLGSSFACQSIGLYVNVTLPTNMDPFGVSGVLVFDHFPFKGTGSATSGSMLIGGKV